MVRRDIAQFIDHTLLKADATEKQIIQLCLEDENSFAANVVPTC